MADKDIKEGDTVSWNWGKGHPSGEVAEVKEHGELAITSNKGNKIKKNASPDDPAVHVSRPGNDVVKRAHELTVEEQGPNHTEKEGSAAPEKKRGKKEGSAAPSTSTKSKKEGSTAPPETTSKRGKKEGSAAPEKKGAGAQKKEGSAAPEKKKGGTKRAASEVNGADDTIEEGEGEKETAPPPAKKAKGAAGAKKAAAAQKATGDAAESKKVRGRPKKGEDAQVGAKEKKTKTPKKAATETGEPRRSGRNAGKA